MILTCPACATSYFVDEAKIGAVGRTVRCASCGHRWTAKAEKPLDLGVDPDSPPVSAPDNADAADIDADTASESPTTDAAGQPLPKVFRARAETKKKVREAAASGVIWACMGALLAIILLAAALFRVDVVRMWPRSASAYAVVGMAVNPTGLTFEKIKADRTLREGHAALTITGAIRNIEDRALTPPPVRIALLDPSGKAVAVKIARPEGASIPPGAVRYFAVSMIDPPSQARDMEISFILDSHAAAAVGKAAHAPAEHPEAAPSLRGAVAPQAPVEVQPLPSDSPYALPTVEGGGAVGPEASPSAAHDAHSGHE